MRDTWHLLKTTDFPSVSRNELEILQVNLGYLCNQSCLHCHVNAGPTRKELMQQENIVHILEVLKHSGAHTLDLTGGAPEMNPLFRELVVAARELGIEVSGSHGRRALETRLIDVVFEEQDGPAIRTAVIGHLDVTRIYPVRLEVLPAGSRCTRVLC